MTQPSDTPQVCPGTLLSLQRTPSGVILRDGGLGLCLTDLHATWLVESLVTALGPDATLGILLRVGLGKRLRVPSLIGKPPTGHPDASTGHVVRTPGKPPLPNPDSGR